MLKNHYNTTIQKDLNLVPPITYWLPTFLEILSLKTIMIPQKQKGFKRANL